MARLLVYYAHPGHQYSRVNSAMAKGAQSTSGITFVDLYAKYPRFDIDIDEEQALLKEHEVILFQHPLFWYSVPPIVKEWFDLVLEHGFAYGSGGNKLKNKIMMNAISAAGPQDAYSKDGYQRYPLRTFLTPIEQTAHLCNMQYSAPYILFSAIKAKEDDEIKIHVESYLQILEAIRDDLYDFEKAISLEFIKAENIPLKVLN